MIKSPLRYPGGKNRASALIYSLIPFFKEFREPFLGGGSIFTYTRQKRPPGKFWINDLSEELFSFWLEAQKQPENLAKQVRTWREQYPNGKDLYTFLKNETFDGLQQAAAFFILNRITFSGTTWSGGYSQSAFEHRFTESSLQRVLQISPLLQGVKITNNDYEVLLLEPGEEVFIFLDPPYYSAAKSALYGKNGNLHMSFDHERFASAMQKCPHKWLITYDDSKYIRNLFHFASIFPWTLTYGMRNVSKNSTSIGKEIFISNFLQEFPSANSQISLFN